MGEIWNTIRQWGYPQAFRVNPIKPSAHLLLLELAALTSSLAEVKKSAILPQEMIPPPGEGGAHKIDKDLAIRLCNDLMRIQRSAAASFQPGSSEGERIKSQMERVRLTLKDFNITYQDLTGQSYDPGALDFEPLGEPDYRPDLPFDTILSCERPVVLIGGKVIQKAKGVVATNKR